VVVTQWPAYDVQRDSVRVLVLDSRERLLLFRTVDPTMPEEGEWWELPGGGMELGEDVAATAVRELAEETGLVVDRDAVRPLPWRRSATYVHRHTRYLQHEQFVLVRLAVPAPTVVGDGRTPEEVAAYLDVRWWSAADLATAAGVRFFPGPLPELVPVALAGAVIDQPFERWN